MERIVALDQVWRGSAGAARFDLLDPIQHGEFVRSFVGYRLRTSPTQSTHYPPLGIVYVVDIPRLRSIDATCDNAHLSPTATSGPHRLGVDRTRGTPRARGRGRGRSEWAHRIKIELHIEVLTQTSSPAGQGLLGWSPGCRIDASAHSTWRPGTAELIAGGLNLCSSIRVPRQTLSLCFKLLNLSYIYYRGCGGLLPWGGWCEISKGVSSKYILKGVREEGVDRDRVGRDRLECRSVDAWGTPICGRLA